MHMCTLLQNQFHIYLQFRIPKRKIQQQIDDLSGSNDLNESDVELEKNPKPLTQSELNDWIRDLDLSKEKSEMLASRMQERNFVISDVKVTYYRARHKPFAKYYLKKDNKMFVIVMTLLVCSKNLARHMIQLNGVYSSTVAN